MRSPRSLWLTDIERGSANSAYVRRAHNAAYAELCISGDPTPSGDDLHLTRQLTAAGTLLGIEVLDHIIVGDGRYVSFREMGHL
jgi:DNA repair protein RadC